MVLDNDQASSLRGHLARAEKELQQRDRGLAILPAHHINFASPDQALLAPHQRLPVELTKKIFSMVVGIPASLPLSGEDGLDPRLQITQVCMDWRKIAFHTPELWKLEFSHIPERSSASQLAHAWWSQCPGSQLSFTVLDQLDFYWHPYNMLFDHFIFDHIIAPFSTRLVVLRVAIRPETVLRLFSLPAGSFEALETLWLRVVDNESRVPLDDSLNDAGPFRQSPNLRHVTLHIESYEDAWWRDMPWAQLKELKFFGRPTPADLVLLVLIQCPLLSTYVVNGIEAIHDGMIDRISNLNNMPLHLPELTWLRIGFVGGASHGPCLRQLTSLPNLSTLRIFCQSYYGWNLSDYITLLQNAPALETLQIINDELQPTIMIQNFRVEKAFLSCVPHLLVFTVPQNHYIENDVLAEIAHGGLLPSVTTMEFAAFQLEPVVEMLETRLSWARDGRTKISEIQQVSLWCYNFSASTLTKIIDLKDQGVEVIRHPHPSDNLDWGFHISSQESGIRIYYP